MCRILQRDVELKASRPLFAAHGFHQVATEAIVQSAGVTRGALYHQFGSKSGLFEQVFETIEAEIIERIVAVIGAKKPNNALQSMQLGALREAAFYLKEHEETEDARNEVAAVFDRMILTLAAPDTSA